MPNSVALPLARFSVGVTGHSVTNPSYSENHVAIRHAMATIYAMIDGIVASHGGLAKPQAHSLLAFGTDALAAEEALESGWDVYAPLPFGLDLNIAINAHPKSAEDAAAMIAGGMPSDPEVASRAEAIRTLAGRVQLFQLADQDKLVGEHFLEMLSHPGDGGAAARYAAIASERAAAAGRVMIEQSDLIVAIWDGVSPGTVGGTRHTIAAALDQGAAVVWIDAREPEIVRILRYPESLDLVGPAATTAEIQALIAELVTPADADQTDRAIRFHTEQWHERSSRRFHAYRRIETLFGDARPFRKLVQTYETPRMVASGSGADLLERARALPGADIAFANALEGHVLARFAWADGLSTYLSDAYRGGMVTNFLLSALAVTVGVAYLPFVSVHWKWPFALGELLLLLSIVGITVVGQKRRWHGRWFETRRVAEYLRHAPILLLMGVGRPGARWPRGSGTLWPEHYARQSLREMGLPRVVVDQAYLRAALKTLLERHVRDQRNYHHYKAARLTRVQHNIDRFAETLFIIAIISVTLYLSLMVGDTLGIIRTGLVERLSKLFTFLGVVLPAAGASLAGIRYFGDFERFAAISEITAEKLEGIDLRITRTLATIGEELSYAKAANLAHAMDDVVVAEIESWQSVFASKTIAVPV